MAARGHGFWRRGIIAMVAIVGLVLLTQWLTAEDPVMVDVATVDRGRVESTVANTRAGTVHACRRARIAPSVGGTVARLAVREGDPVAANQLMLELWNRDISAELELSAREAIAGRATATEACVRADAADREAQRFVELKKKGLAAEDSVDRAVSTAQALRAACKAAEAHASVSAARRDVVQAQLDRTRLHAPFEGRVAELNAELGEYVTPSPPGIPTLPAVDLIDTSCLYVSAPLDEVNAPKVRPGMPVRISLDAWPDKLHEGKVRRVAEYVLETEKQARTVEIEAEFLDLQNAGNLLPGYSADVEVLLDIRENALRIPREALLEGERVLVLDEGAGTLMERKISIGISNWKQAEVTGGLAEGERVVVSLDREGVEPGARAVAQTLKSVHAKSNP